VPGYWAARASEAPVIALLIVGLISYARGPKHYRGDEIGSHGTRVVVVHIVP
jgi:hypothetical protein